MWSLLFLGCSDLRARLPRAPPSRPEIDAILAARQEEVPEGAGAEAWQDALVAWACGVDAGRSRSRVVGLADFSRPSDERRLWVVDLSDGEVLVHGRVAHGSGSGGRVPSRFSPKPGSHATSLGLYRGAETYVGRHGRSLRLDGLEPSNATARSRSVVIHAADYVDDPWVEAHGRAGRSEGCLAVDPDQKDEVIDALAGGLILAWADEPDWRDRSEFLRCGQR